MQRFALFVISLCLPSIALAAPELFFATNDTITHSDAETLDLEPTLVAGCRNPLGIEFHRPSDKVYWVDQCVGSIRRSNIDGSALQDVFFLEPYLKPIDLAFAENGGWIYWVAERTSGVSQIGRVRLDGSDAQTVVPEREGTIGALAIHEGIGKLYWVAVESTVQNTVYRANLDGTAVEEIAGVPDVASLPTSIALDRVRGNVYWGQGEKILFADLDGRNPRHRKE